MVKFLRRNPPIKDFCFGFGSADWTAFGVVVQALSAAGVGGFGQGYNLISLS
jgi:hypothetical protein